MLDRANLALMGTHLKAYCPCKLLQALQEKQHLLQGPENIFLQIHVKRATLCNKQVLPQYKQNNFARCPHINQKWMKEWACFPTLIGVETASRNLWLSVSFSCTGLLEISPRVSQLSGGFENFASLLFSSPSTGRSTVLECNRAVK